MGSSAVDGIYREHGLPNTEASNAQLIAALITAILALISSVVAVVWNARTSRRVKTIELSYPFNKSRLDSLLAFYNATRSSKSFADDVAFRLQFGEKETVSEEEINKAFLSAVESCVAVRDLYDENRHLISKERRRRLDAMLHKVTDMQPSSREDENYKRAGAYFTALSEFADLVRDVTKQEIDSLAEKLSSG
jgi:hypothetical protein